jgi:hypothetical protein
MALTKVQSEMVGSSSSVAFNPSVPIYENTQTVSVTYTLTANCNAMSAGPITIADGVTVTIPNGSSWVVV